jgi:hypothetical protein
MCCRSLSQVLGKTPFFMLLDAVLVLLYNE